MLYIKGFLLYAILGPVIFFLVGFIFHAINGDRYTRDDFLESITIGLFFGIFFAVLAALKIRKNRPK